MTRAKRLKDLYYVRSSNDLSSWSEPALGVSNAEPDTVDVSINRAGGVADAFLRAADFSLPGLATGDRMIVQPIAAGGPGPKERACMPATRSISRPNRMSQLTAPGTNLHIEAAADGRVACTWFATSNEEGTVWGATYTVAGGWQTQKLISAGTNSPLKTRLEVNDIGNAWAFVEYASSGGIVTARF